MLIVLFILFILLIALGAWLMDGCCDGLGFLLSALGFVGVLAVIVFIIANSVHLSETKVVNEKIKMYTEENNKIEKQIDIVVKEYMEYEGKTLSELKGDSSITLVTLYPDLKTDELVKAQITTYQENNKKIKELKEIKINAKVYKWWLYFGK
jgi:uncharacterized membrane protein YhiD involved in acid resistance